MVRCHRGCRIEAAPAPQESAERDICQRGDLSCAVRSDPIIQRIESFRCRRAQLAAERRNQGYTLYRAGSGAPVARLRPTGENDRVEVLYGSLWRERWASAGPFGRTILPIDDALRFIASEDIFWAAG
jgi:hypothetical protein